MTEKLTKGAISLSHQLAAGMIESASILQNETKTVNNVGLKIEAGLMDNRAFHWTDTVNWAFINVSWSEIII